MNVILLSGGSGKRLWPLSNDVRSKQFLKVFKNKNGEYESMLQRVFRQIKRIDPDAAITVAAAKTQRSSIYNQLGNHVDISAEPCRKDTFPAIVLAASYLHDVKGVPENEPVVICPVDSYVEDDYFAALKELCFCTEDTNLALMGIEPAYPSEKYGYIIPESRAKFSRAKAFKEKPDTDTAEKYIRQGALWNGGVFAFRLKYVLDKAREIIGFMDYDELFSKYASLEKISFDYKVVEAEKSIKVMRFSGSWKDLGTWNTLTEALDGNHIGKAIFDETNENVHVINELDVPVVCMGLKNVVISSSPQGILVSDKERSSFLKPFVDKLDETTMFAEKSWGSFQVMDVETESMTIKVTLNAGHKMNYHSHRYRDEIWNVISGKGTVIVDGMEQNIEPGDVITMQAGCRHTVLAETELKLIEVQLGREISIHDKQKYESER